MMEINSVKLNSVFKECESHVQKLNSACKKLEKVFPLVLDIFGDLEENTVVLIDQLIYRFTKLQDAIGHRLFPVIFTVLESDSDPRPFIDILNYLEKIKIIESVEEWQMLRNLRNNLAHDYPESIKQTVDTLNILYTKWRILEDMYHSSENYLQGLKLI